MLHAPDYVISIIERGYALSFNDFPSVCHLQNNKSAFKHSSFVSNTIMELLKNNCIREGQFPPHCVNPLTVAQGKKLRLILDLRDHGVRGGGGAGGGTCPPIFLKL